MLTELRVKVRNNRDLEVFGYRRRPQVFYRVGKNAWFEPVHGKHLAALTNGSGALSGIAIDEMTYESSPLYRQSWFNLLAALVALGVSCAACVQLLWVAIIGRVNMHAVRANYLELSVGLGIALCSIFFWLACAVTALTPDPVELLIATPLLLLAAFATPYLLALGIGAAAFLVRRQAQLTEARTGIVLAMIGAAITIGIAFLWNAHLLAL